MINEECSEGLFDVEYYRMDDGGLGRLKYDHEIEEYFEGEVMDELGEWHDCPADDILADGKEISTTEARERARELDGDL